MTSRALLRGFVPLLVAGFVAFSFSDAAARAGRGRSFGSRGTSSYRTPARAPTPPHDAGRAQPGQPSSPTMALGARQPSGFLRGLAGGVIGGMIGGMLFRSLGYAGPGAGVGGVGLLDLALLVGGAYLLFRFVTARRRTSPAPAGFASYRAGPGLADARHRFAEPEQWAPAAPAPADPLAVGLAGIRQFDPSFDEAQFRDEAQDVFFRVQGAWTRRDLSSVETMLGEEVRRTLRADLEELRRRGEVNRLENIAVREVEIVEAGQDQGQDTVTVRLLANLLDYTTDEAGLVKEGSDREPVKFEEYWTFARPIGAGPWKLAAIQQA